MGHRAIVHIGGDHLSLHQLDAGTALEDFGVIKGHVPTDELGRGDLIEQRLELVVAVLVNQGDPDSAFLAEQLGAGHAGEAAADNDDMGLGGLVHLSMVASAARGCGRIGEYRAPAADDAPGVPVSTNQVLIGVGLTVTLAVGGQVLAQLLRIPALILLLPFGFLAGAFTDVVHPDQLLGASFQPLVSLAVALILYDAGLGLDLSKLTGHTRRVVVRLIAVGVPLTCVLAAWSASLLLGLSAGAAIMLGAIVVVSGPTVVGPLLDFVRPAERPQRILVWEGSLIDPIGATLGAVVFTGVAASAKIGIGKQLGEFALSLGLGLLGGAVGLGLLWLLLRRLSLGEVSGTLAQVGTVVAVAAACDVVRDDTGLIAAIVMGLAVANLRGFDMPARRPFFEVLIRLILGLLFVSIAATVTPASLRHLVAPTLVLVLVLVLVARPLVALVATWGTDLTRGERGLVGWMAPRGIVAAATASTFGATLAAKGIEGASKILPATFLVIVATVTLYGLTAAPVARLLAVVRPVRARPLLIGGDAWVVELARALRSAGLDVLIWAGHPGERERVLAAGFELAPGSALASATGRGAQIEGVNTVLLLTGEDDFNALASTMLVDTVDGGVYRTAPPSRVHGAIAPYTGVETLFTPNLTGAAVRDRHDAGAQIVTRPAAEGIPAGFDLLFVIDREGRLLPVVSGEIPAFDRAHTFVLIAPGTRGWRA
jgi:NhaP-type Na+/H+ or K+/H+ antiporter